LASDRKSKNFGGVKMGESTALNLRLTVFAALFTALIIIGGYLSIPLGAVPIALADFFVMLAGLFLGKKWGLAGAALYVFLGALGLPVYAGGKAGLAVLFGPTGGFLFGYMALAFVVGLIASQKKPSVLRNLTALIAGNILLYAFGIPWLKTVLNLSWEAALTAGLTPFIPGALIKIIVAAAIAQALLPRFNKSIADNAEQPEDEEQ
jgi:biotin transport system substrate-specific component